ncbi:leucyl aminopeptidase family protein [Microbaculum marinum]|uniref:Leucyl aminopeptidase family protein n=1 Tax=Microbaculum marinum TaxID=1764581 RepID=A0AAW9RG36_9HYPH
MTACLLPASTTLASVPIRFVEPGEDGSLEGLGDTECAYLEATGFKPTAGRIALLPDESGKLSRVLFGLGPSGATDRNGLLPGKLADLLPAGTYRFENDPDDGALAVLSFALGRYRFDAYKAGRADGQGKDGGDDVRLIVPDWIDAEDVERIAAGISLARDLINTPSNDMGPAELEAAARQLAERHGAAVAVTEGDDLLEAGFPMIHAVGRASHRAPRLIDITWGDPSALKLTLVGKGVCFDTGGLDIKPAAGMLMMKKDMGGAACVLGLASMVMAAKLPVRLRVLVPAVENAVGGNAFRPGDILRSRKGVTVEIGNTDAEGRLVLADALALADEEHPDLLIDMATLTGAARVALGPDLAAFFSRDEALAVEISRQSHAVQDPVWQLPLWQPYEKMLESKAADINNAGSGPFAGAITAGLFLARFVEKSTSWAHFDAYCWNRSSAPGRPEGGEAQAIRALYALIRNRYAA